MLEFEDLSVGARQRVIALVAQVLPSVPGLSPQLRRVAAFTPGRRARTGASALAAALATEEFRSHAGTQAAVLPEPANAADPVELVAWLWLVRPDGWEERLDEAQARTHEGEDDHAAVVAQLRSENERLRQEAVERVRELRAEHRSRLEELKVENADLRRKLGLARASLREVAGTQETERAQGAAAVAEAGKARELAETEARRLRIRLDEVERTSAASRAEQRASRDEETVRARLLLDTVIDAANGLRRELALPRVEGTPAARVAAQLDQAASEAGLGSTAPLASASHLEQYLALPQAHLVLDGYNVTRSVWEDVALETQRNRLLALLPSLAARTNAEVTVVFDAGAVKNRPVVAVPRGVRVVFSPPGVIADDVIRDLVAAEPTGRPVLVVTADAAVVRDVRADGAVVVNPSALLSLLARDLRT